MQFFSVLLLIYSHHQEGRHIVTMRLKIMLLLLSWMATLSAVNAKVIHSRGLIARDEMGGLVIRNRNTCTVNGKVYRANERIEDESDPCMSCICGAVRGICNFTISSVLVICKCEIIIAFHWRYCISAIDIKTRRNQLLSLVSILQVDSLLPHHYVLFVFIGWSYHMQQLLVYRPALC